jgi:hypothetical protein
MSTDYVTCWNNIFDQYINLDIKCSEYIDTIKEIKENLSTLLGDQKKDDIVFYRSIIDNSYFYLSSSIKTRKIKFLKDLNCIAKKININKEIDCINKSNYSFILKEYIKIQYSIDKNKSNTILTWVKNNRIESLQEFEKDMTEAIKYHYELLINLSQFIELEKIFYNERNQKMRIRSDMIENYDMKESYNMKETYNMNANL